MTKEALKLALEALEDLGMKYFESTGEVLYKETFTAIKEALAQPEQEPVAWLHTKIEGVAVPHRPDDLDKHPDRWEALYKTPSPCPTCEALARTVMLDQTSYDTTPPQRKPLTDEEIRKANHHMVDGAYDYSFKQGVKWAEYKHGIKGEA